jgi:hypothetical protein
MTKLSDVNVKELLGPAPISGVTDREIWSQLLTPQVKCLLGKIESIVVPTQTMELAVPLFPGDEISNLNQHLLYGKPGYVRIPYVATVYKTANGYLVIKRDHNKFKASCWIGDIFKGKGELIYKVAMRDRRHDGTLRANDCALLDFTYDDKGNVPLPFDTKSVEVSVYAFAPGSRIAAACGDAELEAFVANPFKFLDRPELFKSLFDRAWKSQRSPGQVAASIGDVAKIIGHKFDKIASQYGYDFLEDAASHYHVAMFAMALGYRCTYEDQAAQLKAIHDGIEAIKKSGIKLTRPQESWVCVLQSLPVEMIPKELYLGGQKWMQDNISADNLWFNKPLTEKAKLLMPGTIKRQPQS